MCLNVMVSNVNVVYISYLTWSLEDVSHAYFSQILNLWLLLLI